MGKIPQVNGKINRENRKRAGKCRPASETVTADRSEQLAYYFCQTLHILSIVIEGKADAQNITADIGHNILLVQHLVERWRTIPAKGQKTCMWTGSHRVEQFEIRQLSVCQKLRLKTRHMV